MKVTSLPIEGLKIIQPVIFEDERGYFFESYNEEKFFEAGIKEHFVQDNQSKSNKGVLRGLHFQEPPYAQGKLVRVINGAVLDVAVDIRKNSPTYGQHFLIELTETNKTMFYIPPGFAHGFLTLIDNTVFSYKCTELYNNKSEKTILWNDKDIDIHWNFDNPTLSAKDKIGIPFSQYISLF
ncbi:MAG: dTDP-4-dehydrorhamnose 3,5-epimerase [Bacteroidetes bacterium]|nr:dTDP-4-dehydrorhamnose 3,5-epimerase [Bacteroidota bacterium]